MAYKKSINHLTISKLKSKDLLEWFIGVATWRDISKALDIGHSKVFKFKRILRGRVEQIPPFDALAETFTVKELNDVITMYNDYLENPDNYKQTKKRSEIDLEAQTNTVNKHLAEMGDMKLETPKQKKYEEKAKQEDVQESEEVTEQEGVQESKEVAEQEGVQESEEVAEQEDVQESKEVAEQEDVQESKEVAEQEDVQESKEVAEQEGVQETEEAQEHIDKTKNNAEGKKREINFNSQKPLKIFEAWKNKNNK
ncbi:hypothetical protein NGH46_12530 [Staphylococcus xylosus]|uniref:hypothetical protein n=1 Tax=Staphylococcus xylosus TaxID=1288 RepID=UPI002DBC993F|nr:hypothetical protein [Staphylococcus xylosus]MEB8122951.1 hypothetical protein [Staphylococcus xylosus]